jgi:hypothetical protein
MSLAINAAPFESDQNTNNNPIKKNSLLSSKLAQFKQLNKSKPKSNHNKTQKAFKEGFDFKMDKDKMEAMLKNVQNMIVNDDSDDENSMGDYKSIGNYKSIGDYKSMDYDNNNLLPPPQSAGTERTKLKDNHKEKEGFEPLALNQEDTQMELQDYSNYGNENENEEYYRRVLPGYSGNSQNLTSNLGENSSNDVLLKKINYMIQLLEEQHDEKTNNVTEEVVLYSFLGVFMIFIVDSFAKVGKYVR